jgi:transcriptional regulator with XRE-family HTH domain
MPRVKKEEIVSIEKQKDFIRWMIKERDRRNWTQEKMAEQLGFSTSYYNALENGKKRITLSMMMKAADVLEGHEFVKPLLAQDYPKGFYYMFSEPQRLFPRDHPTAWEESFSTALQEQTMEIFQHYLQRNYYVAPVTVNLEWFGLSTDQLAVLQPINDLFRLEEGQLVYVLLREAAEDLKADLSFMFVEEKPFLSLITPEAKLAKDLALSRERRNEVFESTHQMELVRIPVDPYFYERYVAFSVTAIFDQLVKPLTAYMHPAQRQLSTRLKNVLVEQTLIWNNLQLKSSAISHEVTVF